MKSGDRTYVATAFVPFRWRRVDAVATRLVTALRDIGLHAERLRIPVTMTREGAVGSAAAASLVNLAGADGIISLEFPCLHLVADHISAFRVRGGFDDHLLPSGASDMAVVPSRCVPDHAEPGAASPPACATIPLPPGLVGIDLRTRGIITDEAEQLLVISLDRSSAPIAQAIAAEAPGSLVIQADGDGLNSEARLWETLGSLAPEPVQAVHVVVAAADGETPQWVPDLAGADERWTIVDVDGIRSVARHQGDPAHAWNEFARSLLP